MELLRSFDEEIQQNTEVSSYQVATSNHKKDGLVSTIFITYVNIYYGAKSADQ